MFLKLSIAVVIFMEACFVSFAHAGTEQEKKSNKITSTTKAYKITNDGRTENSTVLEYDNIAPHKVYEDNDLDGRFGESERRGVDSDLDRRQGESEDQLGTENITLNQKVTVLNNMGSRKSLSTFQAAGQTQRSSIFVEEKKSAKKNSAPPVSEPLEETEDEAESKTKRRVLVS